MKLLLWLAALLEIPTGLTLLAAPAIVVRLLLGAEVGGTAVPLARVAGVALLALGVACWLVSYDVQGCAARGVVSALALYNLGVALVLASSVAASSPGGIALWTAVILHTGLGAWCIVSLWKKASPGGREA